MKLITFYLPWLLSAVTIWMNLLAGNKHPKAWLVGLFNQLLWLIWIIASQTWGNDSNEFGPMGCLWKKSSQMGK